MRSNKVDNKVGVVVDVFGDLDENNPWVRVRWTVPMHAFEWCKQEGLAIISENIPPDTCDE